MTEGQISLGPVRGREISKGYPPRPMLALARPGMTRVVLIFHPHGGNGATCPVHGILFTMSKSERVRVCTNIRSCEGEHFARGAETATMRKNANEGPTKPRRNTRKRQRDKSSIAAGGNNNDEGAIFPRPIGGEGQGEGVVVTEQTFESRLARPKLHKNAKRLRREQTDAE